MSLTAVTAACGLAFALVRPGGRPVEEWLAAALLFCASPRQARWMIADPRTEDWRPSFDTWQQLSPHALWMDEDGYGEDDAEPADERA